MTTEGKFYVRIKGIKKNIVSSNILIIINNKRNAYLKQKLIHIKETCNYIINYILKERNIIFIIIILDKMIILFNIGYNI